MIQLVWLLLGLSWLIGNRRDFLCLAAEHPAAASAHPFRNVANWFQVLSLNDHDSQGLTDADIRLVAIKE